MSMAGGAGNDERLFTGYAGRLSILLAVSWFVIKAGRDVVPAVLPQISADLGLSPVQVGVAMTLTWACYAVSQYPGGHLADHLTRKTVLVGGFLAMIGGFSWLALAGSCAVFLGALSLVGVGAAMFFTPSRALVSDLFTERRGSAVSIQVAAGRAGSAAAGPIAAVVVAVSVWQAALLPVVVSLVAVTLAMHRYNRDPYVLEAVSLNPGGTARRILVAGRTRLVLIAYVLFAFTSQAFTSFLPTVLQIEKGLSPTVASLSFTALFVVGVVSTLAAGDLGDRFSRPGVGAGSLALGAAGIGVLLWAQTTPLVISGVVVYGVGIWAFSPVMQAHLMDVLAAETLGNDFGAIKTVYTGIGSLGPAYVGLVAEWGSYTVAFAGLGLVLVAGTAVLGWLVLTA